MKRMLLGLSALLLCPLLAACPGPTPPPATAGTTTPLPSDPAQAVQLATQTLDQVTTVLTKTTADERILLIGWNGYDLGLTLVDQLHLEKNSPKALRVRRLLLDARLALRGMTAAQKAGSSGDWQVSLTQARTAFDDLSAAIK